MKRLLYTISTLLFILTILFASPSTVLANEEEGGNQLEAEVDGYRVTLTSQNDWAKGENEIVVTLADSMGMPVRNADVEILIVPTTDGDADTEMDDAHGAEPEESMPGMDMGEPATETPAVPTHDEETADPISMMESDEHGMYMTETHLESAGQHEVHVLFHASGEMLQADFVVDVPGANSKVIVLWSFAVINVALVACAGMLSQSRKQTVTVKGGQ